MSSSAKEKQVAIDAKLAGNATITSLSNPDTGILSSLDHP
jgi:hypothetical protein